MVVVAAKVRLGQIGDAGPGTRGQRAASGAGIHLVDATLAKAVGLAAAAGASAAVVAAGSAAGKAGLAVSVVQAGNAAAGQAVRIAVSDAGVPLARAPPVAPLERALAGVAVAVAATLGARRNGGAFAGSAAALTPSAQG
ncbi:MAG: hypothetical protein LIQ30_10315, partial [Planctomycetes bacterium]|nr:hypothetical protein [Planctomycetota bacterium]